MADLPPVTERRAEIGVFGGSGFYALLDDADEVTVETPYGAPSGPFVVGSVGGRSVAFLPRHGPGHRYPPHHIPYRANLWAMRSLGVTQIVGPCAAGSLSPSVRPGDFVVVDQLVDRTSGRTQTFWDDRAVHVSFADPYCPRGRTAALKAAAAVGITAHDGGTMVVVEGPRFSTRAESRWFSDAGWSVVNMTGHPEAVLARELELCYTSIALITDYDVGVPGVPAVTAEEVFRVFQDNNARLRELLFALLPELPDDRDCACARALTGADFSG